MLRWAWCLLAGALLGAVLGATRSSSSSAAGPEEWQLVAAFAACFFGAYRIPARRREPRVLAGVLAACGLFAGLGLALARGARCEAAWFVALVATFHAGEFLFVAACHPRELCAEAFLLQNGPYTAAVALALLEWGLERGLFAGVVHPKLLGAGLAVAGLGQLLRWWAFWSARGNFTHYIARTRRKSHVLVTGGAYRSAPGGVRTPASQDKVQVPAFSGVLPSCGRRPWRRWAFGSAELPGTLERRELWAGIGRARRL